MENVYEHLRLANWLNLRKIDGDLLFRRRYSERLSDVMSTTKTELSSLAHATGFISKILGKGGMLTNSELTAGGALGWRQGDELYVFKTERIVDTFCRRVKNKLGILADGLTLENAKKNTQNFLDKANEIVGFACRNAVPDDVKKSIEEEANKYVSTLIHLTYSRLFTSCARTQNSFVIRSIAKKNIGAKRREFTQYFTSAAINNIIYNYQRECDGINMHDFDLAKVNLEQEYAKDIDKYVATHSVGESLRLIERSGSHASFAFALEPKRGAFSVWLDQAELLAATESGTISGNKRSSRL